MSEICISAEAARKQRCRPNAKSCRFFRFVIQCFLHTYMYILRTEGERDARALFLFRFSWELWTRVLLCWCTSLYIYIYIQRERDSFPHNPYIYIYIYIYLSIPQTAFTLYGLCIVFLSQVAFSWRCFLRCSSLDYVFFYICSYFLDVQGPKVDFLGGLGDLEPPIPLQRGIEIIKTSFSSSWGSLGLSLTPFERRLGSLGSLRASFYGIFDNVAYAVQAKSYI